MELQIGSLLNHKYRIEKTLGQGGFGITYLAIHVDLKLKFCIKELFIREVCSRKHMQVIANDNAQMKFDDFIRRFFREAKQLAEFNHPGIVKVSDVFKDNGTAYFVMEYVEGKTLSQVINVDGKLNTIRAAELMTQLQNAIEYIHNKNVLHLDIKPDNIIVNKDDKIVIIDFGTARKYNVGAEKTTMAFVSHSYAPLEQYDPSAIKGTWTDVYALGAVWYFMLTGVKPTPAISRFSQPLPPPHHLEPTLDKLTSNAIMKAVSMNAQERFQNIMEFRKASDSASKTNIIDTNLYQQRPPEIYKKGRLWGFAGVLILSLIFILIYNLKKNPEKLNSKKIKTESGKTINPDFNPNKQEEKETGNSIKIGNQIWMKSNLNRKTMRNGDRIIEAKNYNEWIKAHNAKQPAFCYYNSDIKNGGTYGLLYNYYAVIDKGGISPPGWRVPSKQDWDQLETFLKESLKAKKTDISNIFLSNKSILGGFRYEDGSYRQIGKCGFWWCSDGENRENLCISNTDFYSWKVTTNAKFGYSIICIKN